MPWLAHMFNIIDEYIHIYIYIYRVHPASCLQFFTLIPSLCIQTRYSSKSKILSEIVIKPVFLCFQRGQDPRSESHAQHQH